jgi:hypothetical protein
MASVTSHGSGRFLCVEPQRSFEPASVVVRSSAMAPLPSLVRGLVVDGIETMADGIEPIARMTSQSNRARHRLKAARLQRWRARLTTLWLQIYSYAEPDRF